MRITASLQTLRLLNGNLLSYTKSIVYIPGDGSVSVLLSGLEVLLTVLSESIPGDGSVSRLLSGLEVLLTTLLGDGIFVFLEGTPIVSKNLSLASSTKDCGNLNFEPLSSLLFLEPKIPRRCLFRFFQMLTSPPHDCEQRVANSSNVVLSSSSRT